MIKFFYSKDDQAGIVKALGLVFGDIGTSPIYTLTVIFLLLEATPLNIIGIISLVIWTLIIIVFIEYVILVMSLDIHGEGGTLILRSILEKFLKNKKGVFVISILAFLGVSLILGEGVITPAISVLSAVEGARLIPGCENLYLSIVLGISMVIAVLLFIFQSRGTDKIASRFGPIMIVWFVSIGIIGLISSIITPEIFKALNPFYAVQFMIHHGWTGFFLLSQVILCATGSEALYADMGHLGRKPIVHAWISFLFHLYCATWDRVRFYFGIQRPKSFVHNNPEHFSGILYSVFNYHDISDSNRVTSAYQRCIFDSISGYQFGNFSAHEG